MIETNGNMMCLLRPTDLTIFVYYYLLQSGRTPLHQAVVNGHTEVVKLLLDMSDVNVNRPNSVNCSNEHILDNMLDSTFRLGVLH